MSLRPKRVDFNAVWKNMQQDLTALFSGDAVYQVYQVYEQIYVGQVVLTGGASHKVRDYVDVDQDTPMDGSSRAMAGSSHLYEKSVQAASPIKAIDLYQDVYDLCVAYPKPLAETLYQHLGLYFVQHCSQVRKTIMKSEDIIHAYATCWQRYHHAVQGVNVMCDYLNRLIVKKLTLPTTGGAGVGSTDSLSAKGKGPARVGSASNGSGGKTDVAPTPKMPVDALAYLIWREAVLYHIKDYQGNKLVLALLEHMDLVRRGLAPERQTVSEAIRSMVTSCQYAQQPLAQYLVEFEAKMISATTDFYATEAMSALATLPVTGYMTRAAERLAEEERRAGLYLDKSSVDKVVGAVVGAWLGTEGQGAIQDAFSGMLRENRLDEMACAYGLLVRVPEALAPVLQTLETYVTQRCKAEIALLPPSAIGKDPGIYVNCLMHLHQCYFRWLHRCFEADALFETALDKAFRSITNDAQCNKAARAPELMARFTDYLLVRRRVGVVNQDASDIDENLDEMMTVFKYMDEKDVFQKMYATLLARRLIFDNSVSSEREANMLARLKTACGYEYTSKLQRMFTDMSLSRGTNEKFQVFQSTIRQRLPLNCTVNVLTAGAWPLSMPSEEKPEHRYQLPPLMAMCTSAFDNFYQAQHNGRRLTWLHHLARVDLWYHCKHRVGSPLTRARRYDLFVTAYQASILLLFNASEGEEDGAVPQRTISSIANVIRMTEGEVKSAIAPMVELGLLTVTPTMASPSAWSSDSTVTLSSSFTSKRMKIKLAPPHLSHPHPDLDQPNASGKASSGTRNDGASSSDTNDTRRIVQQDRRLYLEAAVVRLMKARRRLHHPDLLRLVTEQATETARFTPTTAMIKTCLEALLDKGYIERSETDHQLFLYIA